MQCQICQTVLPAGARICPRCGAPTPYNVLEPERGQLASAAGGVATSSSSEMLSNAAPDDTLVADDSERTLRAPSRWQGYTPSSAEPAGGPVQGSPALGGATPASTPVPPAGGPVQGSPVLGGGATPAATPVPPAGGPVQGSPALGGGATPAATPVPPAGGPVQGSPALGGATPASTPVPPAAAQAPSTSYGWQSPPFAPTPGSSPAYPGYSGQLGPQSATPPTPSSPDWATPSYYTNPSEVSPPRRQPSYGPPAYFGAPVPPVSQPSYPGIAGQPFPPQPGQPGQPFPPQPGQPGQPFPPQPGQPFQPGLAPAAPTAPRSRSNLVLLMVLAIVVILVGGGLFTYLGVIRPNQEHAAATATSQAFTAVAQTQATATARAQAQATATTTALLKDPQGLYTFVTSQPPSINDSLSSQGNAGWDDTKNSDGSGCQFTGGALHVFTSKSQPVWACLANAGIYSDFAFQVDMKISKGFLAGIVFRYDQVGQRLYAFNISPDGRYFLTSASGSSTSTLAQGTSTSIQPGLSQVNTLAVIARGSTFYLYINKRFVATANDSSSSSGHLGLLAISQQNTSADVAFNNAEIWELH
jgi:hypothetical protein